MCHVAAGGMSFPGKVGFTKATGCSSPTKHCFVSGHSGNRVNLDSEVDLPKRLSSLEGTSVQTDMKNAEIAFEKEGRTLKSPGCDGQGVGVYSE